MRAIRRAPVRIMKMKIVFSVRERCNKQAIVSFPIMINPSPLALSFANIDEVLRSTDSTSALK